MPRSHARRDTPTLHADALRTLLDDTGLASSRWDEADRRACERVFVALRRGRDEPADRAVLQAAIRRRIDALQSLRA
jgi:hypothetical protein